jgi:hypothetical protein
MRNLLSLTLLLFTSFLLAQTKIKGQVIDFDTTIPISFATVVHEGKTTTTDWEGRFSVTVSDFKKPIVFKYKGYYDKFAYANSKTTFLLIKAVTDINQKKQEMYTDNEVNKIIKKVIENRDINDPDEKLVSYEYKNYEYIQVSANPDSISSKIDTIHKRNIFGRRKIKLDSTNYKFKKIIENQHLYQTEKVNLIQHNQQGDKETVLATRMAGFKQPIYEFLGLKLISYSVYENPFEILETPVQNPISNYGRILYNYTLIDTVKVDGRSAYRIYFQPKKLRSNRLRGLLYIDTKTFAISKAYYRIYGIVNINATYTFDYLKDQNLWFPKKREFKVHKGSNKEDLKILGGTIKFKASLEQDNDNNTSDHAYLHIESTPFDIKINKPIQISKPKIKIDVPASSLNKPKSFWNEFTKDTIDKRKINTYTSIDSLSVSERIEDRIFLGRKIINGYFPISIFDIDLRSIAKYNNFEGFRFGIGAITNDKLAENYRIAFYGAYGLKDEVFKFGIAPSYQIDKISETWVSASYTDDLNEIAQTSFATDLRRFKIYDPRPINISTFYNAKTSSVSIESKILAKTNSYFSIAHNSITPLFDYTYNVNGASYTKYDISTAQLSLQWNPFSNYMQTPLGLIEYEKRHPKFSLQFTQTLPGITEKEINFSKIDFKTYYEIPYLSGQKSTVLFQGGIAFGNAPLTHLYSIAPNNINQDAILKRITFAGKNSFETMYYNEFFSDRFLSLQLKHTFNRVNIAYKINPEFSFATRFAWGTIDHPENHIGLPFKSLERGFIESGIEANKVFKGLGLTTYYRYGPNQLSNFDDNISIKITYFLDLGF